MAITKPTIITIIEKAGLLNPKISSGTEKLTPKGIPTALAETVIMAPAKKQNKIPLQFDLQQDYLLEKRFVNLLKWVLYNYKNDYYNH